MRALWANIQRALCGGTNPRSDGARAFGVVLLMAEHDPNINGLKWEWLVARIFASVAVPLLLAAIVAALVLPSNSLPFLSAGTAISTAQRRAADIALCSTVLTVTQGFGLVPKFTQLASAVVKDENGHGRYSCFARTGAARYQITFDLMCTNLADAKCISLYMVAQDGTGPIYQRH